jgi:RNA polymerase sigma factor (sigma-70 family)
MIDPSVIKGCMANDVKSQELLYRSFYEEMMRICLRYVKNPEDAVEVLNTGFLKVFRHLHTYSGKGNIGGWIRQIMINSALDFLRSKKMLQTHNNLENLSEQVTAGNQTADGRLHQHDLLKLLQSLPAMMQTVFNLFAIEGYTYKEIEKMLGISAGTCKWYVHEARKQVQQWYASLNNTNKVA